MKACLVSLLLLVPVWVAGPNVMPKGGNIFYVAAGGRSIQITSEGLDSAPSISCDGQKIVFVRKTPGYVIDTGLGDVEDNELWIASIRVAVGPTPNPGKV
jgi:hypothetical protein